MRILFSAVSTYSPFGSESAVAHHYASILGKSHELFVLTARPTDMGGTIPGVREVQAFDLGSVNLNEVSRESLMAFERRQWPAARKLIPGGIDVIHRVNPCSIDAPTLLGRLNRPLVVGPLLSSPPLLEPFREIMWREVRHYKSTSSLRRRLRLRARTADLVVGLFRRNASYLRRAKLILVGSAPTMDDIPQPLRGRCLPIVYAGVEHNLFTPPAAGHPLTRGGEPVRLLYAGRLKPHKGIELLLRACAKIRKGREFTLSVIGRGTPFFKGFVRDLVESLDLHDRVRFLPEVRREAMPDLYRDHDIFCLPTLSDTYGVALLEAMSSGLPVVVSDLGGPREIVADGTGVRIPTIGPDQFVADCAAALADLVDHPSRREALGQAARRHILGRHDWGKIGARLEAAYASIG